MKGASVCNPQFLLNLLRPACRRATSGRFGLMAAAGAAWLLAYNLIQPFANWLA